MKLSKIAALLLLSLCAGCGTLRHQTSCDWPHATLELSEYIPTYVVAVWCDNRRVPVDSRRAYRITVGEHQLRTKLERRQVRTLSADEQAAWGLVGWAVDIASSFAFRETSGETQDVSDTSASRERYSQTTRFTAAAGQAYVFNGYLVKPKEQP